MTVTFDGITLQNPEPFEIDPQIITNDTVLLSGKHSGQLSSETAISLTLVCYTATYSDVSDLIAKIGTKADLIIDGTTYTKCYISSFPRSLWAKGEWTYTVAFKQDTT